MNETDKSSGNAKRSAQRAQLIQALLQQPTLEKAAAAAGISVSTAFRIRKSAKFQKEFEQVCADEVAQTCGRVRHASGTAASVLMKIMLDATLPAGSRCRAAESILGRAIQLQSEIRHDRGDRNESGATSEESAAEAAAAKKAQEALMNSAVAEHVRTLREWRRTFTDPPSCDLSTMQAGPLETPEHREVQS